jgi:hypothetical protein
VHQKREVVLLRLLSTCDFSAPSTTLSATNGDGTSYAPGTWTHQTVNVVLTAADTGGSGTKESI